MPAPHPSRRESLPHRDALSAEAQRRWARYWLRLSWTRPRYLAVRFMIFSLFVGAYFYFGVGAFVHAGKSWFWTAFPFLVAFGVSETVTDALSKREIASLIAQELATQGPNQAMQPTADRPYA